jgi:integrase
VSGLGLRVTRAGARSYIYESRLFGKTIRVTIGDASAWGLGDARTEAARLKTLVDSGTDPREHAAEQRAAHEARQFEAQRKAVTVAEAWADYVEYLRTKTAARSKKPRSDRYINEHLLYAAPGGEPKKRGKGLTKPGALWPLMELTLSRLTGPRVAEWLESEAGERPTAAAYAYRMLRAFIRWCGSREKYRNIIPADAYMAKDVTDAVPRAGERSDRLERSQLAAWFKAVQQLPPITAAYLQGLLFNGPRRGELEALRWDDIDFRWGRLHLKDKVDAEGRTIPMTPYFENLLLELKRVNDTPPSIRRLRSIEAEGKTWKPSPWVFPSLTSESGHIEEPRKAHARALQVAGISHLTLHGLRRSFASLAQTKWLDVPAGVVAQIQGHKPSAVQEKHYTRRTLDELREWHNRIEAWMLEQAGIDFKAEQTESDLHAVG